MNEFSASWFPFCQGFGRLLKVVYDSLELRIPVLNDDGSIESLTLNYGTCSFDGKPFRCSMFSEPCEKQTVTVCLTPVTIVAHVEQNIKMLLEEHFKNSKNGFFYFCIMWGASTFQFLNHKLKSITLSQRIFSFKRNKIVDVETGSKHEIAIRSIKDFVWRLSVDFFKGKLNHSDTIVPVSPISLNSLSMRSSAACLISRECLKRAKASSYVIFFFSMIITCLY